MGSSELPEPPLDPPLDAPFCTFVVKIFDDIKVVCVELV